MTTKIDALLEIAQALHSENISQAGLTRLRRAEKALGLDSADAEELEFHVGYRNSQHELDPRFTKKEAMKK